MNSRICPTEEALSEYLAGTLKDKDKEILEKHLAGCDDCRRLLAETHEILKRPDIFDIKKNISRWIRKNLWLAGAIAAFSCSFIFPKYFLQFLVACILMGAKWIIDTRTTKTLIMIREAWKQGDLEKTDKLLSRFGPKKY